MDSRFFCRLVKDETDHLISSKEEYQIGRKGNRTYVFLGPIALPIVEVARINYPFYEDLDVEVLSFTFQSDYSGMLDDGTAYVYYKEEYRNE